jgi:hypothetical protein
LRKKRTVAGRIQGDGSDSDELEGCSKGPIVVVIEIGRLETVEIEYEIRRVNPGSLPNRWDDDFRAIPSIAGDIIGPKLSDIGHDPGSPVRECLTADSMDPDRGTGRTVPTSGEDERIHFRIPTIEPQPTDAGRRQMTPRGLHEVFEGIDGRTRGRYGQFRKEGRMGRLAIPAHADSLLRRAMPSSDGPFSTASSSRT